MKIQNFYNFAANIHTYTGYVFEIEGIQQLFSHKSLQCDYLVFSSVSLGGLITLAS